MASIETGKIKIALLRLTDSAPVIMAEALGLFAQAGLDVEISIEPSWANIADKLSYGLIDAAVMLPPLAFAIALGLRGPKAEVIVPLSLSSGGNSVTFTRDIATGLAEDCAQHTGTAMPDALALGRGFGKWLAARAPRSGPARLGIVHVFSTHNLLLRYWLAAAGIHPDEDVELIVVPPAQMIEALAERRIIGFCAGAPWGRLAGEAGLARAVLPCSAIWQHHPEKCLAVAARFAELNPQALEALLGALLAAAQYCEVTANTNIVAAQVAETLSLPLAAVTTSLPGATPEPGIDRSHFFAQATSFPWRSHGYWFLSQMARWGWLEQGTDLVAVAAHVYRPDLYVKAAAAAGLTIPLAEWKAEGAHETAWTLAAAPTPIAMASDIFCDGKIFSSPVVSA
jgi:NitT/TauT family transport system ATP-binding protein/nitrate/nitrite transport system substrate-binding protein